MRDPIVYKAGAEDFRVRRRDHSGKLREVGIFTTKEQALAYVAKLNAVSKNETEALMYRTINEYQDKLIAHAREEHELLLEAYKLLNALEIKFNFSSEATKLMERLDKHFTG